MPKILGHRVLVQVDKVEEKSAGGIIVYTENDKSRAQMAVCTGVVIEIGAQAYKEFGEGDSWVKEGDRVYFQKYGGIDVRENDIAYRILNDEDILAIKT